MKQTTLDMFRKTPEEVVRERRAPGFVQPELSEEKKKLDAKFTKLMAKFLQENDLPPSVIDNINFDIMLEAVRQFGPNFVPPSK